MVQIGPDPTWPILQVSSLNLFTSYNSQTTVLAHERLSIVGVDSGAQPLTNSDESIALAVNGEIYNHRVIRKGLKVPYHFKTHSDCEVIIPLVREDIQI